MALLYRFRENTTMPQPLRLPDWVLTAVEKDPAFRLITMDGQGWIDPYTGQVVAAPFGYHDVALRHMATTKPWLKGDIKPLKELLHSRWLHYLNEQVHFIEQLRIFQHGLWLNPYTGQWLSGIRLDHGRMTQTTVDDMARALGKCAEAQTGMLLEADVLQDLINSGPPTHDHAAEQQTSAHEKLKTQADFSFAKKQFIKMLPKPPKIPGYQVVLHYEPHSAIPRNFYDFISLDTERIMLVIGDLSGDGPGAALLAEKTMRTMRRLATMRADLLDFFAQLNDDLRVDQVPGCSVGLFAAVLHTQFHSLTCLNMGFHPAILLNPGRDTPLQQIHTQGDRLGVSRGQPFRSTLRPMSMKLHSGDIVAFFSDGLSRAANPRDMQAGRLTIMGSFAGAQELTSSAMLAQVVNEAKARTSGPIIDDLTALALRVKFPNESPNKITPNYLPATTPPVAKPLRR
jgi:serine phosphatase RsbU (regulator of sigma subunit)